MTIPAIENVSLLLSFLLSKYLTSCWVFFTISPVRSILRLKLTVSFFVVSMISVLVPMVLGRIVHDTTVLWLAAGLCVLGVGCLASVFLAGSFVRNLQEVSTLIHRVAKGDLTQEVHLAKPSLLPDEMDALAGSFNDTLVHLRDLVVAISRTSQAVAESAQNLNVGTDSANEVTREVTASIEKISHGATVQQELVERASRIITKMAGDIERTARVAEDAKITSDETASVALSGGKVGKQVVDKLQKIIERIENTGNRSQRFVEKSKEVGQFVEMISKLSQQTNLLALNATIEAARAGDYGRGFAVVADEIRKLAENTAKRADQIAMLTQASLDEAVKSVMAMQESTLELNDGCMEMNAMVHSLENISMTAKKGVAVVDQISRITHEQLEDARSMVEAIEHISYVVDSNVETGAQVTAAILKQSAPLQTMAARSVDLMHLSDDLTNVTSRYHLTSAITSMPGQRSRESR